MRTAAADVRYPTKEERLLAAFAKERPRIAREIMGKRLFEAAKVAAKETTYKGVALAGGVMRKAIKAKSPKLYRRLWGKMYRE